MVGRRRFGILAAGALAASTLVVGTSPGGPAGADLLPTPPAQPAPGEPGGNGPCGVSAPRVIDNPAPVANQTEPLPVYIYLPTGEAKSPFVGGTCGKGAKPTVFFAHGYQIHDPASYSRAIAHWVSLGNVVVYADYEGNLADPPELSGAFLELTFRQVDIGNQTAAAAEPRIDTRRVGFVGHSHGAGMTPYLTHEADARGWGQKALWLLDQSQAYTQMFGDGPIDLPDHTHAVVLAMDNDRFADNRNGIEVFGALQLPTSQKEHVTVRSHTRGTTVLDASHTIPADTAPADAMMFYGYYRQSDLVEGCALGTLPCDTDPTYMGEWSDGVPVTSAIATDRPVDSGPIPVILAECDLGLAVFLNPRIGNCPESRL